MSDRPLSRHLLLRLSPIVIGGIALGSLAGYWAARAVVLDQLESRARGNAAAGAARAQAAWNGGREELETVSRSPVFADYFSNRDFALYHEAEMYRREIERMLLDESRPSGPFESISFFGPENRLIASADDRAAGPAAGTWTVPVLDKAERRRGSLVGRVRLGAVARELQAMRIGESGRVALESGPASLEGVSRVGRRIVVSAPVTGTPLRVAFSVDRAEFTRPLRSVAAATLLAGALTTLLLFLALPGQLDGLLSPIRALAEAARALAAGDLEAAAPVGGPREVSQVAAAFNSMLASVRRLLERTAASEARYRTAVENSPHAVISLDQNRLVTLWNRRAEALFGYQPTEAFGRTPAFLFEADDYARLERQIELEGAARDVEVRGVARDGRALLLSVSWTGQTSPAGAREWFVVAQDVTERKRLETHLIRAEKLSAVGSLIAGVAHELNNPLAAVAGLAEILQDAKLGDEERADLRHLHASALRCRDIVQGLLSFSRGGEPARRRVRLNGVARAALGLLEYRLVKADRIAVELELDPADPAVAGDFSRLQQVAVNLMANAGDALRSRAGRRVIRLHTSAVDGRVELAVEDTGPGVPERLREKIFEPFVTTKPAGLGTGLGLSISSEIARECGGGLRCEAAPGGGARFVLSLPPCPDGLPDAEPAGRLPPACPGRDVLVVDDEPELASLMARLLHEDGLFVQTAADADAAKAALDRTRFDLVVSDVDLGSSDAFALFDALGEASRPLFVFVTGDVLNEALARQAATRGAAIVTKPFLRTEFLRATRRALNGLPA